MTNSIADSLDGALGRFGLESFRPGQREVIEAIVSGENCMCIMPTGGGKSLCFQLPSLIRNGLTIVVSPLIALMKDQVDRLGQLGIPAALINSTLSAGEQQTTLQDVAAGKYQMVYVAPERLRNTRFQEAIRATPVQLLAIDEAHCISQWGHDFRPDYARIGKFREWLGGVQTVALTATATPRVRDDIVEVLGLEKPKQFMSGFARPNLHFGVVTCQNDREKDEQLESFLAGTQGSGIIYSATRKRCDALVEMISKKLKISVGAYHAGLMQDQRRVIQERFMTGKLRVIVATNAFGMGIDKSDLRFVVHYNMPGSLEAYYQEAGRAGRDGKLSQCVMLYSYQDRYIQEFFIDNNYPSRQTIESVYEFMSAREEDPIELTLEEIRDALGLSISPEAIGNSLQVLARSRVLKRLEMGSGLAVIRIDSQLPTLVDMLPREAKVRRNVMRLLERAVGDRRGENVSVHPKWLLEQAGMGRDTLLRALREISKLKGVDYCPPFRGRAVHFTRHGVPFRDLEIDFAKLDKLKEAEMERVNHVVRYAQSPLCRQTTILKYFGDPSADDCTRCDRCGGRPGWPKFPASQEGDSSSPVASGKIAAPVGAASKAAATQPTAASPSQMRALEAILDAIERIHGRLGKHLIAQYLCGSQNAKVQKLNLHRLSSFGLLKSFRQSDAVSLLDALLAAGVLSQQEVNRNRPTVCVSPQLADSQLRKEVLSKVSLPQNLAAKLRSLGLGGPEPTAGRPPHGKQSPAQPSAPSGAASAAVAPGQAGSGRPASAAAPAKAAPSGERETGYASSNRADVSSTSSSEGLFDKEPHPLLAEQPESKSRNDTEQPSSGNSAGESSDSGVADWYWTLKLFSAGYVWEDVLRSRQMTDPQLCESLMTALKSGSPVRRAWISGRGSELSLGQQRLIREIQRRNAAGIQ